MRKEGGTLDDVIRSLPEEKLNPYPEELQQELPDAVENPASEEAPQTSLEEVEIAWPDEETPTDE
jgi:hypothetical protein